MLYTTIISYFYCTMFRYVIKYSSLWTGLCLKTKNIQELLPRQYSEIKVKYWFGILINKHIQSKVSFNTDVSASISTDP
jgi:hypothetical protein